MGRLWLGKFSMRGPLLVKASQTQIHIKSKHEAFTGRVARTVVYSGSGWLCVQPSSMASTDIYRGPTESGHPTRHQDYEDFLKSSFRQWECYKITAQ